MSARDTQVGGDHYRQLSVQPWDVFPEWLEGWSPFQAFLAGNIFKYLCRAPRKGDTITDLRKARHYLDHLINMAEHDDRDPNPYPVPPDPADQFP